MLRRIRTSDIKLGLSVPLVVEKHTHVGREIRGWQFGKGGDMEIHVIYVIVYVNW